MVDTVNKKATVLEIFQVIEEHKGEDPVGLFIGEQCSWTDYFIIATATSATHLKSLGKHVKAFLKEREIEPLTRQRYLDDDSWILIDCGYFVVHIMSREKRDFYELEKLWFLGEVIYSSKSS